MKKFVLTFVAALFLSALSVRAADCGSCDKAAKPGEAKSAAKCPAETADAGQGGKNAANTAKPLPAECAKCEHKDVCKCLGTCPGGVCRNKCKGEHKCSEAAASKCSGCRGRAAKPTAPKTEAKPGN